MDPAAERRREWARLLLQQADALHRELQIAQSTADHEDFLADDAASKTTSRSKAAAAAAAPLVAAKIRHSEAVRAAEAEVRRMRQRATLAKQRLASAKADPATNTLRPRAKSRTTAQPAATADGAVPAEASANASAAAGAPSDATTARPPSATEMMSQAELYRMKGDLLRQQREVAALREREIALAGVLCALKPATGKAKGASPTSTPGAGASDAAQPARTRSKG